MKQVGIVMILAALCSNFSLYSQVVDFDLPADACLEERMQLKNTSVGVIDSYLWDFCEGDLTRSITATTVNRLNTIDQVAGIVTVKQGGNYFSMLIDRTTGTLYRLSFGNSLTNLPVVDPVALPPEAVMLSPQGFKLIQVGNQWFGFLVSSGNNRIYRLDFGNQLTGSPSATELNFLGNLNTPIELELAKDGSDFFILVVNFSGNNIAIARLGQSITNQPQAVNSSLIPGASNPYGFSLKQYGDGVWRGVVGSFSNGGFHAVSFDNGLGQPPVISSIASLLPVIVNPVKLALETWGEESVLLVVTAAGSVNRIHFSRGSVLSSVQSSDMLGNFGQTLAVSLLYDNGNWRGFTFSNSTRDLRILYFDSACSEVSIGSSSGEDPPIIQYFSSGLKDISLVAMIDGILMRKTRSVSISLLPAPLIDFANDGICVSNPVVFSPSSNQSLIDLEWSFGDLNTSPLSNPSHEYIVPGIYDVKLAVGSNNGCSNFILKQIKIYPSPMASFELPTGIICTNNEYPIINTTDDVFDGNLSYTWLVNDDFVTADRDLNHTFSEIGDQQIRLTTSIPGCSSESSQSVSNVLDGPDVNFNFNGQCEGVPVTFTNLTSGEVISFSWDFDDGNTSADLHAEHIFSDPGQYTVSLSASTELGCLNKQTRIVSIYTSPVVSFSLALPPFSCSGSASQFTDLTPPPTDSNITSWNWTFSDTENNTAVIKNPTHTYTNAGEYAVNLKVTTNFGCEGTLTKNVTIAQTPAGDFSNTPVCLNQPATFTPANTSEIKSWLWSMPNATYTGQNPVHAFTATGNQPVTLMATANNNCVGTMSKNLVVPVPVAVNFSATSTCAGKPVVFTETTLEETDPAASWSWDFAGQATAATSTASHVFPAIGSYNVQLNSMRQSGCTYSVTNSISIIHPPVSNFTVPFTSGPAPLTVGFTNTSTQASSYLWKFNDTDNSTSTAFSPSFVFDELGTYLVELVASNTVGCSDSFVTDISVVVPEMNAAVTDFVMTPNPDGTWKGIVTIQNKSNMAISNPEVHLDLAGRSQIKEKVIATLQPNQTYTQTISTDFVASNLSYVCAEVRLPSDGNAFDDRQCANLDNESMALAPYPNPVSDELVLNWINLGDEQLQVTIFSSAGQVVMDQGYSPLLPDLNQVRVDVSGLKPGIYYVSFKSGTRQSNYRFAVVR